MGAAFGSGRGLVWAAAIVVLAGGAARGAERVVLCEEFTWTNCYYCGFAGSALDLMVDNHPDTFALVQIHVIDGYATPWGNSRADFYGVPGTPTAEFDGVLEVVGSATNVNYQYSSYNYRYNLRRNVATDVSLAVVGAAAAENAYLVRARIAIEPGGAAKTMRIHIAQVLDHWPVSPAYHRNGFKQAATPADVTVNPGEFQLVERTFTLDADSLSHVADVKFVVWAQTPNSSEPAQVHQAAVMHWPFPADCNANGLADTVDIVNGVELDCNANGRPDSCEIAAGDVYDQNANGVPDPCEMLSGDLDCNWSVDFGDINPFVLALTDPVAYHATYPACDPLNGDLDDSGTVDFGDINPFVVRLTGGE